MFEVLYTAQAEADIRSAYRAARRHAPLTAGPWIQRMYAAIDDLAGMSERFAVVDNDSADLGFEVREMLFGNRRRAYRILPNWVVVSVERALRNR